MLNKQLKHEQDEFLTHVIDIKFEKFFNLIFTEENIINWDTAKDEIFKIKKLLAKRIPNFYIFTDVLNRRIIKVGYKYKIFTKEKTKIILVNYFEDERNEAAMDMVYQNRLKTGLDSILLLIGVHFFMEFEDISIDYDGINFITIGELGIQVKHLPSLEILIESCEEFKQVINLNIPEDNIEEIEE